MLHEYEPMIKVGFDQSDYSNIQHEKSYIINMMLDSTGAIAVSALCIHVGSKVCKNELGKMWLSYIGVWRNLFRIQETFYIYPY